MSAAERQRRYLARQAANRVVLRVEVDEFELAEFLIDAGFLELAASDDRDALRSALEKWIAASVTRQVTSLIGGDSHPNRRS